ncbi:hydrogenase maturation protease [Synechococcus sp. CS-1328]|uniref:hydrogenase maturation protease n=1 Tax=Synechococcus sp. CS-1328 TaxID=2847976 RepID=UPI00223B828E|nr:hydrogenase maturation protease [Synechococcus sp. CS-1328]MCT0224152.1 hydrogenase maturation protease [Synechococcus sp. CS-1328]
MERCWRRGNGSDGGSPAALMAAESTVLVIGIGNLLRQDDGVGRWLVEDLAQEKRAQEKRAQESPARESLAQQDWSRRMPELQLRPCHQLLPELAEDLARSERVLFVDAWLAGAGDPGSDQPRLERLDSASRQGEPGPEGDADDSVEGGLGAHRCGPEQLLQLCAWAYGHRPAAWVLLVPGEHFGHGTHWSPRLQRQLPEARALLRRWLAGPEDACTN